LLHNHPTGDAKASASDIKTTKEISSTLKNLDIKILDHLIIARGGCFSFSAEGLL
jgi:DNA repair protein RadC